MKILISPAKSLNYDTKIPSKTYQQPKFLSDSSKLIKDLKKLSQNDIATLMKISPNLSKLNRDRYQSFSTPFTSKNAKPAIYVFNGDVYDGIDIQNYNENHLKYIQSNLRILSGLYGILKPLDLMQPYRLEMGTKFENERGKNLYDFWKKSLTSYLNEEEGDLIINLASEEYFKAIDKKETKAKIINIDFKENKDGKYKIIGIFAKKARGIMVDWLTKNNIQKVEDIKGFSSNNYKYSKEQSSESSLVFCR